jgi:hypothetical protein
MTSSRVADLKVGPVFVLLICLELLTVASHGAETAQAISPDGRTELTLAKSSNALVRVSITQIKVGDSFSYKNALLWGGDVDRLPEFVLSSVVIQEGNETIFVPLSAYSDLGDVKLASLNASSNGFILNLHGGNTASGYDVILMFSRGYLVSRTVRLREFPEERLEKTTYSFPKHE